MPRQPIREMRSPHGGADGVIAALGRGHPLGQRAGELGEALDERTAEQHQHSDGRHQRCAHHQGDGRTAALHMPAALHGRHRGAQDQRQEHRDEQEQQHLSQDAGQHNHRSRGDHDPGAEEHRQVRTVVSSRGADPGIPTGAVPPVGIGTGRRVRHDEAFP